MAWLFLIGAIAAEVTATLALRASDGFTRFQPSVLVIAGYSVAFYLLSLALVRGMPLAIAYAVWAAAGIALITAIGVFFLGEHLTWLQVLGITLLVGGVLAIELGTAPSQSHDAGTSG